MPDLKPLLELVHEATRAGVFSGAQAEVGTLDGPVANLEVGRTGLAHCTQDSATAVHRATLFDLASVTKAAATSVAVMLAVQRGLLTTETKLGAVLLNLPVALAETPVSVLLQHQSGLVDWLPFYEQVPTSLLGTPEGLSLVRQAVVQQPLAPHPVQRYSDLGFILLGWLLEVVAGQGLEHTFQQWIAQPLGLTHTGFLPLRAGHQPEDIAFSEVVDWRGGLIERGVVHDENTWAMGGVSGHAGLFGTAADLGRLARALLQADAGKADWLEPAVLHFCWDRARLYPEGSFVLGWDTPSGEVSSAGRSATRTAAVGHLGFTGTSLWLDRARAAYIVLLTNRVHPKRTDQRIKAFRPRFHDLAWTLVDAAQQETR
ncbi:MAG: hypothetical protein AUK47_23555 [Deltaproteobacteria bacterium CG2_30_63_29]|nr:MAG: hypothetical protein AUK47_23555 [Deltaproteobacteria bacterium CG2_30_63_29]PIW01083.1 MAG: serine hydrolase [Deltaproteobacteria bacterium CG17_big_fil_post_rev_8_21_14_2_50_63_7]PJB43911.1 MAG: serine hydrolase [Deltaproteobacteria bacterium CG_4_9_14_3_um_filter_63_12]